jgi:protein tyrosine phosphatase
MLINHSITNIFYSVFQVVRLIREQRYGAVNDLAQYAYIYEFINKWIKENIK